MQGRGLNSYILHRGGRRLVLFAMPRRLASAPAAGPMRSAYPDTDISGFPVTYVAIRAVLDRLIKADIPSHSTGVNDD